jgi:hypothetical protein
MPKDSKGHGSDPDYVHNRRSGQREESESNVLSSQEAMKLKKKGEAEIARLRKTGIKPYRGM